MRAENMDNNQINLPFESVVDYIVDQIAGGSEADSNCDNPNHIHIHH